MAATKVGILMECTLVQGFNFDGLEPNLHVFLLSNQEIEVSLLLVLEQKVLALFISQW